MKYDFSTIINRSSMDALAVDAIGTASAPGSPKEGFDVIPMWVADMNFATAPAIQEAIAQRTAHPLFGYFNPRKEYFDSIIRWQESRNHVTGLTEECIGYENGVLGGVISALNAFASPGDSVLLHSPTYIGFTNSISSNGFRIVLSPLVKDQEGIWRMDYEDMDKKLRENKIHTAVFCNPHNPCGRVWEPWEIQKAMEVYKANDCIVISDEIWSDLILEGYQHTPAQSVSEDARNRTIALYSPSKTFNLAGLIGSYHIIYNSYLRDRVRAQSEKSGYNHMNVLSMHGLIGAYSPAGQEWLEELLSVLTENVDFAYNHICRHYEGISVSRPQGTYMLFPDCTRWCQTHETDIGQLLKLGWDAGVAWQDGRPFHGPHSIRMNLALPLSRVREAFHRLDTHVFLG